MTAFQRKSDALHRISVESPSFQRKSDAVHRIFVEGIAFENVVPISLYKKIYNFYVLMKGIFKESLGILKDVENITNLTIFFPLFMIPAGGSPVDDVLLSARKFICALSSMDAFT